MRDGVPPWLAVLPILLLGAALGPKDSADRSSGEQATQNPARRRAFPGPADPSPTFIRPCVVGSETTRS
jgi:hypothetical protein